MFGGGSPVWFYLLMISEKSPPGTGTVLDTKIKDEEANVPTSQKYIQSDYIDWNEWNPHLICILHAIPKRKSSVSSVYLDDFGIELSIIGSVSI